MVGEGGRLLVVFRLFSVVFGGAFCGAFCVLLLIFLFVLSFECVFGCGMFFFNSVCLVAIDVFRLFIY